jgi:cytochrome c biogenesis protein CcdA
VLLLGLAGGSGAGRPATETAAAERAAESVAAEAPGSSSTSEPDVVVVRFFYGEECPYCHRQLVAMEAWERDLDVEIHRYEVWHDDANRALFQRLATAYGGEANAVPMTFIGERAWSGFDEDIDRRMRAAIEACSEQACIDPMQVLDPEGTGAAGPDAPSAPGSVAGPTPPPPGPGDADDPATIQVPLVGSVDTDAMGLLPATALIAFVDGFNPCSLWVLSVLLAMLLRTGSRRRIAVVGGAFLVTTAAVYGLFIAGVFTAMSYVGYLAGIRWAVALLALTFAAVNIKDYFAFRKGFSFTIPDRHKPRIYRGGRGLLDQDRSLLAVTGAAVLMALGISLVELPCTAGFPVVWSGLLADAGTGGAEFAGLLSVYLGIYLLDEIVLFTAVVVTLRIAKFQERHGQMLKLVGGTVMLALGVVMLVSPAVMNTVGGTLLVFLAAALATAVIHVVTHQVRTRRAPSR